MAISQVGWFLRYFGVMKRRNRRGDCRSGGFAFEGLLVRLYISGSLPAAVVGRPVVGSAAAYLRWACRVRRCSSTQSGQRVCPWIALFGQFLHSPSFLRRWRFSRECARERSRFSSSVSWGLVGLVVDLRLAEPARALSPGLATLRFRGRVLPALAGLGRMKVNSKVPPIAHVCGFT